MPYLLIFPSIMIMVTVIFYPIAVSLLRSFQLEEGGWGPDNYIFFFTDRIQRGNILYTLEIVMATVVLAIGISYFLAIYLRFSDSVVSRAIGHLYLLPRFIPWNGGSEWHDHGYPGFRTDQPDLTALWTEYQAWSYV
ncbi:MAG: hypothetical protein ACLUAR_12520 [Pilosibacter sp.]